MEAYVSSTDSNTPRLTLKSVADTVATQGEALVEILSILKGAQHSTPVAVAEAVVETPAEPVAETASDKLLAFVADKGLAFARGGRTYLDAEMLKAQVRVLKTGTPEVLPYSDSTGNLHKRGVSHIAIGRTDDGSSTFTQFVYTPES